MEQRKQLIDIFLDINIQVNLSAIRDADGVYTKHICDALEITKIIDLTTISSLCDVGTGWGFPLLALAKKLGGEEVSDVFPASWRSACPSFVGIDARRKKVSAITTMIEKMNLKNCKAIWSRIEDHHQTYDIVTARAVAYADKIIPRCVPLCKVWGKICLYKQVDAVEREEIVRQCKKHKLILEQEHIYTLFEGDIERVIYVLARGS